MGTSDIYISNGGTLVPMSFTSAMEEYGYQWHLLQNWRNIGTNGIYISTGGTWVPVAFTSALEENLVPEAFTTALEEYWYQWHLHQHQRKIWYLRHLHQQWRNIGTSGIYTSTAGTSVPVSFTSTIIVTFIPLTPIDTIPT
jgi:hypothetical protein